MFFLIKYLIRRFRQRQAKASAPPAGDGPQANELAGPPPAPVSRARRPSGPPAAARGPLALLAHQVRYDLKTSLRNPRARFMTFVFPILLLVVFNGVFGGGHTVVAGVQISLARFYVPGIIAMSIVVGSYANLVQSITTMRETGVLKRRRATPVPATTLIAAQAVTTVVIVAMMTTLLLAIARVFYSVGFAPSAIAAIACTASVATLAFACIGYLVSGLIGSPEAAMPVVQATMLPLWFISGVFIPTKSLSSSLRAIADIFPVEHAANSLHLASVSSSFASALSGTDLLVLAGWALAAGALAAWRFSWLPSTAAA